jgi:hypothetical protein
MPTPTTNQQVAAIPFFFILGRPRSGTTLLRTLFDAHPNVTIPVECSFLINMSQKYKNVKNWTSDLLMEFFEDAQKHIKFKSWDLDLDKVKADLLECEGKNTFQNVCKVIYFNFNSLFPKEDIRWIGDKNPVYAKYAPELLKLFPEVKFIHLIRDPRDNIISLKAMDFEMPSVALIAYRWEYSARKLYYFKKKHPGNFYTIRYEDLVSDPTRYYREMCDYLSIPYYESVFDFYKKQDEALKKFDSNIVLKYHKSLLSPINTSKVDRWKTELSEREIRIAESVAGRWTEVYGYERRYRKPGLNARLYSIPWLIYGRVLYASFIIVDLLPFSMKIVLKNNGKILPRLFMKVSKLFS